MKLGKKKTLQISKCSALKNSFRCTVIRTLKTVIKDLASHVLFLAYPSPQYTNSNLLAQNPSKQ